MADQISCSFRNKKTGTATPSQCAELEKEFDHVSLVIQSSDLKPKEIATWLQAIKDAFIARNYNVFVCHVNFLHDLQILIITMVTHLVINDY